VTPDDLRKILANEQLQNWSVRKHRYPGISTPQVVAESPDAQFMGTYLSGRFVVEYTPKGASGLSWTGSSESDLRAAIRAAVEQAEAGAATIQRAVKKSAKLALEGLGK
jgi:hypothetical protein